MLHKIHIFSDAAIDLLVHFILQSELRVNIIVLSILCLTYTYFRNQT